MKLKKHVNIPVFVPHAGCPHDCVFCNQKKITGRQGFDLLAAEKEITHALSTVDLNSTHAEIAFFGGSFTGIELSDMLGLLEISDKFVRSGLVSSVRCSTRPDYINVEILEILKEHHVKTVEIGVQSMDNKVLSACARGHTAADTEKACRLIVEKGFDLVGQMMLGLPCSTPESELMTAGAICDFGAVGARIYPTVVFEDTALLKMTECGDYTPLSVEQAVERCAPVIGVFAHRNVDIIRIGLCESEGLHENGIRGGAFHPALGEMCLSRYYLDRVMSDLCRLITNRSSSFTAAISVADSELSKLIGQRRCNKNALKSLYPNARFTFKTDAKLLPFEIRTLIT